MDREWSLAARIILLVTLVLGLAGCYEQQPAPRINGEQRPLALPPAQNPPRQHLIGRSVQGRPIFVQIVGRGSDTVLIMGAIHGDERPTVTLMDQLAKYLQDDQRLVQNQRVVLLPIANPDGYAAKTRENARGIDLNRNFDTANRIDNGTNGLRPLTEPESQALRDMIKEYAPSRIVTIHTALNCLDYDGPGQAIAARMAQECDLEVKKLGARPGSLGSYTGETLGIPTVTMELAPEAGKMSESALWQKYGKALLAAILYPERAL